MNAPAKVKQNDWQLTTQSLGVMNFGALLSSRALEMSARTVGVSMARSS